MRTRNQYQIAMARLGLIGILLAIAACDGSDDSPTSPGTSPNAAIVKVTARKSKVSANLHAVVTTGTQDTYASDQVSTQELTLFQMGVDVGGAFDDGAGSTANGTGSSDQLSSLTAQGSPDTITGCQASGEFSGSASAVSVASTGITSRSTGASIFDLDFVTEDSRTEILIKGSFVLEGENSFGTIDLRGRDGSGALLQEEFTAANSPVQFEYTVTLVQGERFEFAVAINSVAVVFVEDAAAGSESAHAAFSLTAEFLTPAPPARDPGAN
jgi:hypothetical protein